ncbi:hypothetical protein ACWEO4_44775 [Streptomyces sp. NPDC004393]
MLSWDSGSTPLSSTGQSLGSALSLGCVDADAEAEADAVALSLAEVDAA